METPTQTNRSVLVWDLPTRAFHWMLGTAVVGALSIALLSKGNSSLFPVHMLLGALAAVMVLLRVVWGFVGSRYARFRSFTFGPGKVLAYFKGVFSRSDERWMGHNPGSSAAIFAMLALLLGTALTGLFLASGPSWVRELHPIFAWTLLGLAVLHVLGVLVHTFRHRANIIGAMVDGRKAPLGAANASPAIRSSHPVVALVFIAIVASFGGIAVRGYDATARSVALPGIATKISLRPARKAKGPGLGAPSRPRTSAR
jgi:cytochrome b